MSSLQAPAPLSASRPAQRVLAIYLALATPPLLLPGRPAAWPLWLALHALVLLLAWPPGPLARALERAAARWPRASALVFDWYPILLVPALYSELAQLIPAVHGGRYFDGIIQQVEQALFGGQPSRELARAFPHLWASELLHASYLSYYPLIYVPPILLYAGGARQQARYAIFSLMLAYVLHYLVFIYFPVQGPRYIYPAPGGELAEGPAYRLAHWILEAGSSRGAAFPSSHVGIAVAQVLTVWRFQRRLAPVVLVLTLLLALGAVYGGFHYATDALAGALLGTAAVAFAPTAFHLLGGAWRETASQP